jgi:hypothetical protein
MGMAVRILSQYYLRDDFRDRQAAGNLSWDEHHFFVVYHQAALSFFDYSGGGPVALYN